MPSIRHRRPEASPEIEYGEVYIPDDRNLGTGEFTTLLRPSALSKSRAIFSIMVNPPAFQISVNINPGTRETPVLLGKADGSDPVSRKVFILPPSVDSAVKHRFVARFEEWQITSLEMDGEQLREKAVGIDWNICTPTLFRYLPSSYVDAFFGDGSLRLSSFETFGQHEDEQRLDVREGKTYFVHRTNQGGGQTIEAWATHGTHAYVLSSSMLCDQELMEAFGCDSYIRINDSTKFGMAVSHHIPSFVAGFEGPCLYQGKKIIERDLGFIDIKRFRDPDNPDQIRRDLLNDFIISRMRHFPFFLKERSYSHQVEYRFVWVVGDRIGDYLDVKVPEAVQFCGRPSELTE